MTGTIETVLRARRDEGRKLLVPYVTGGLGDDWTAVVEAVAAAGADAVEVGIPFSDPVMDGPVIQEASQRALAAGITPAAIVTALGKVDTGGVPIVVMTYYNLVFRAGHTRFARSAGRPGHRRAPSSPTCPSTSSTGGATRPTRPAWRRSCWPPPPRPTTAWSPSASGPGAGSTASASWASPASARPWPTSATLMAKRLKAVTDKPVLIGIGVSTPAQAAEAAADADGVIVGSALVRRLLEGRRARRRGRLRGRAPGRPRHPVGPLPSPPGRRPRM